MRILIVLVVIVGSIAAGATYYVKWLAAEPQASFRTTNVRRGDLLLTIGATGTVEPEFVVDIGAQVVGRIKGLGIDPERLRAELKRLGAAPDKLEKLGPDNLESVLLDVAQALKSPVEPERLQSKVNELGLDPGRLQQLKQSQLLGLGIGILEELGVSQFKDLGIELIRIRPNELPTAWASGSLKCAVDYRSHLQVGSELALIDPAIYVAQLDQARAALARAEADLAQSEAKLTQTEAEWKRAQRLRPDLVKPEDLAGEGQVAIQTPVPVPDLDKPVRRTIADADFVLARANYLVAKASLGVGQAAVEQAQAALDLATTNLGYTTIVSTAKGEILDRRVNVGQTVVASLNAPSLFLIATDLTRLEVWASVNEADIGRIRQGMPVQFSVDAYPGETFRGTVKQVRLNATMTQNVVTYTVVVATDNANLKLLPYLTANLQFEVEEHKGVLVVPNAALRWKPRAALIAPELREKLAAESSSRGGRGGATEGRPAGDAGERKTNPSKAEPGKAERKREDRGRLWVKEGGFVRPLEVQIGGTDGSNTEVGGDQVQEGVEIVLAEIRAASDSGDVSNPFAPKIFQGRPKTQP